MQVSAHPASIWLLLALEGDASLKSYNVGSPHTVYIGAMTCWVLQQNIASGVSVVAKAVDASQCKLALCSAWISPIALAHVVDIQSSELHISSIREF